MLREASQFDLLIIGGGINGAGLARDAAGRGLRVLLVEQGDLAEGTSSRSSKLVHGGLRYLETFQLRLVREALQEREVLLKIAPHIVRPLRFILPHVRQMRSRWKLGLGLWLYDRLGGPRTLPTSGAIDLTRAQEGRALRPDYQHGFQYADCWVEDMRLVVLNAQDAAARGAIIRTRTKVESLTAQDGIWRVRLSANGIEEVMAKAVINAAGPWVGEVQGLATPQLKPPVRLIKGSHIVVPRLYEGNWAYLCQNPDGRVVFFLPYERDFTLIGTTDVPFEGNPATVTCSTQERDYLLATAQQYFKQPPGPLAIVHSFAGVRSLYDDGATDAKDITRDYVLKLDLAPAPMLSIYGGKITTYRRLAEHALDKLAVLFPNLAAPWTATAPLPGGDLGGVSFEAFITSLVGRYPWVPSALLLRWSQTYGTAISTLIGQADSLADLGKEILPGLYEAEVDYLTAHEFAKTAEDILWRRTRLGLRLTPDAAALLAKHL